MEVQFVKPLQSMWDTAVRDKSADLEFALGTIADVILEIFDSLETKLETALQHRPSVSHALEIARGALTVLDACQLIASTVLSMPAELCFHELELPSGGGYPSLDRLLYENTRNPIDDRPFVYVVWNRNPQRFLYVATCRRDGGKPDRHALESSEELRHSLERSSLVTLICPRATSASLASSIEAALLSVLDSQRAFPDFNNRSQMAAHSRLPLHIEEIGRLISEISIHPQ